MGNLEELLCKNTIGLPTQKFVVGGAYTFPKKMGKIEHFLTHIICKPNNFFLEKRTMPNFYLGFYLQFPFFKFFLAIKISKP